MTKKIRDIFITLNRMGKQKWSSGPKEGRSLSKKPGLQFDPPKGYSLGAKTNQKWTNPHKN